MPRVRKLEIVPEGTQRNGQDVPLSVLESVVRNFNEDARPPITLGHPPKGADQVAALGRVGNLTIVTNSKGKSTLVGDMIYTPELEELEDSGKFEGQSAGIYKYPDKEDEYYLHHLAQLGQLPPAAEIKTQNVQLSDAGEESAFLLSAHIVSDENKSETKIMKFKDLMASVKSFSDEEKKELGEALGFKADAEPKGDDTPTDNKKKTDEPEPTDDKTENPEVKAMREAMASDRRESLAELADSANLSDGMKATVKKMIKSSSDIELCAAGENSRYNEIKTIIKSTPTAATFNPTQEFNLSDGKDEPKGYSSFNSEGW